MFELLHTTPLGRRGRLHTAHGVIETPFFMPVGTGGAMRGITHKDLLDLEAQILLCNTYHLHLHPGEDTIARAGGLHRFIHWEKPILTDSGGFQVFSLKSMRKITEEGVHFRSHVNGDPLFLGPESATEIQHKLGADIIMCFDECPPSTASRKDIEAAVDRTLKWAKICKETHVRLAQKTSAPPLLFGIVQGGLERDLREKCARELLAIGFDGYAIGGLAVGESEEAMFEVLQWVCPLLPADKPRYLMGVGVLHQLIKCVSLGIDMFDCVLPMRIARHGTILLTSGEELKITNAPYKEAHEPIDPLSPSDFSQSHARSYLHHLFKTNERLAETIACKQNLGVTLKMMRDLRAEIVARATP
ncbi:MAG: tRNA guanosine(34) transglycosylase Tgt [Candidatus Peribacteraceae bacterium]|nr:tRNA guanosine(34) transglycosylase Tgt [Candidatus Peribacteraceae bacterium]